MAAVDRGGRVTDELLVSGFYRRAPTFRISNLLVHVSFDLQLTAAACTTNPFLSTLGQLLRHGMRFGLETPFPARHAATSQCHFRAVDELQSN